MDDLRLAPARQALPPLRMIVTLIAVGRVGAILVVALDPGRRGAPYGMAGCRAFS
jgi:hypothetical protein